MLALVLRAVGAQQEAVRCKATCLCAHVLFVCLSDSRLSASFYVYLSIREECRNRRNAHVLTTQVQFRGMSFAPRREWCRFASLGSCAFLGYTQPLTPCRFCCSCRCILSMSCSGFAHRGIYCWRTSGEWGELALMKISFPACKPKATVCTPCCKMYSVSNLAKSSGEVSGRHYPICNMELERCS